MRFEQRSPYWFFLSVLGLLLFAVSCAQNPYDLDSSPRVKIGSGVLVGSRLSQQGGVFVGVPFAAPPVGENRWRAPSEVRPWSGEREAMTFAPACIQGRYTTSWYAGLIEDFGHNPNIAARPVSESEDCLYLNIWSPDLTATADLPVMVWIHGGGYTGGWSYEPNYLGANLAMKGVVVVSVAYRLGPFGYIGPDDGANFGLMDQVRALEWIQENVRQFGGNPGNVTLFGESAGAASIGTLMVTPSAKGLFHRAIHQSGGFEFIEQATSEDNGRAFTKLIDKLPASGVFTATSQEIFLASQTALPDHWYTPVEDGDWLPAAPRVLLERGKLHKVDLMIGTNSDEWLMYIDRSSLKEQLAEWRLRLPEAVETIDALVVAHGEIGALDRLETAHQMRCPGQSLSDGVLKNGGQVFYYRFSRVRASRQGKKIGSYHGAEIPYVFDTHDRWLPTEKTDRDLTKKMMSAWVAFAISGDPNAALRWPEFGDTGEVLEFGDEIKAAKPWAMELCASLATMAANSP